MSRNTEAMYAQAQQRAQERAFSVTEPRTQVPSKMTPEELVTAIMLNKLYTDSDTVRLHEDLFFELVRRYQAIITRGVA